ncbi:U11/U12 small nuclear ribonucleoprotein 48 kDa protein-like [Pomacea canaliculata]|nr:U11/U12 small nuclear ribonucleoprotein 48 kDa protein-like [Pomacea canaliculata]
MFLSWGSPRSDVLDTRIYSAEKNNDRMSTRSSSLLPGDSLNTHASKCELLKRGCPREDLEMQLQNEDVFYEKADLVGKVHIDEKLLNTIIQNHYMESGQVFTEHRSLPVCPSDASATMSPEERIAVYNYCVQQLKDRGKMPNVEKDEILTTDWEKIIKKGLLEQADGKPQTAQDLLALLRDQKRRRQSYRAKNVHITRKSYTEIIREVINNQVEMLMPSQEIHNRLENPAEKCIAPEIKDPSPVHRRQQSPDSRNHYSQDRSPWEKQKQGREKTKTARWQEDKHSSEKDQQKGSSYDSSRGQGRKQDTSCSTSERQKKRHADKLDSESRWHIKKHKRKHKKHKSRHDSYSDDNHCSS